MDGVQIRTTTEVTIVRDAWGHEPEPPPPEADASTSFARILRALANISVLIEHALIAASLATKALLACMLYGYARVATALAYLAVKHEYMALYVEASAGGSPKTLAKWAELTPEEVAELQSNVRNSVPPGAARALPKGDA